MLHTWRLTAIGRARIRRAGPLSRARRRAHPLRPLDLLRTFPLLPSFVLVPVFLALLAPPPARAVESLSFDLDTLGLTLTQSRALAGDTWTDDFDRGWRTSSGTQAAATAGFSLHRARWRARLLWSGRWGESLPAQGRLEEAWLEYREARLRLRAGRAPLHWAPARAADLLISTHARPLDHALVSTRREQLPLVPGGGLAETFVAYLDDRHRAVPFPLLWGMRARWSPLDWLSLEAQRTILLGGAGRTEKLSASDVWDIFLGRGESTSGEAPGPEHFSPRETDQKFAWQLVARLPRRVADRLGVRQAEGFYIYAGEDAFRGLRPMAPARAWGLRVAPSPRIAAGLLRVSTACRENIWYWHKVYLDGYRYRGYALGQPMGGDARLWQFDLAATLSGGLLASVEIAREERGIHNIERGVLPGGHWRWSCACSVPGPGVRIHTRLGAATAWGADRSGRRPAAGYVQVGVSLAREQGVARPDRLALWGVPEGE